MKVLGPFLCRVDFVLISFQNMTAKIHLTRMGYTILMLEVDLHTHTQN